MILLILQMIFHELLSKYIETFFLEVERHIFFLKNISCCVRSKNFLSSSFSNSQFRISLMLTSHKIHAQIILSQYSIYNQIEDL